MNHSYSSVSAVRSTATEAQPDDLIDIVSDTEQEEQEEEECALEDVTTEISMNQDSDKENCAEPSVSQGSDRDNCAESKDSVGRRINRLKSRVHRQKMRIQKLETELEAEKKKASSDCMAGLSKAAKTIFSLQRRTAGMAPKARRYTEDEMTQALALYYQGARAYRFLRKQFVLPSTRVLRKNMEKIRLRPGFHDAVLGVMKEKFKSASPSQKMCVLSFDEMTVKTKLTYLRGAEMIEGYQDLGRLGRQKVVATHALVFMVRGVTTQWKQAIGYFLSSGPAKAASIKDLIIDSIGKLKEAGMNVIATVCDMGAANQQTYKLLGVDRCGSFRCGDEKVTALHDVPHLFKCLRNALINYDISVDGKVAKWRHLVQLHNADKDRPLRVVPKLKALHLRPTAFKKMTVRLATQALSRSVAAGLSLYTDFGKRVSLEHLI